MWHYNILISEPNSGWIHPVSTRVSTTSLVVDYFVFISQTYIAQLTLGLRAVLVT